MKVSYQTYTEYKENKLASKQADKMYNTLMKMWEGKASSEDFQNYYKELRRSHLYLKHSCLYCQVLLDFAWNRKPQWLYERRA